MMSTKIIWHMLGLAAATALGYGTYLVWGQIPAWTKGTYFNDLRYLIVLLAFFIILTFGEAVWSRLPGRPKAGLGTKSTDHD